METFAPARDLVADPGFARARRRALAALDPVEIDAPIRDVVAAFAALPHVFTLQCCCGHFLVDPGQDPHDCAPLPPCVSGPVTYRIAYLALCLENGPRGRALLASLARLPAIDPDYVQFGSPTWFWDRRPNSYALQVEPAAHMTQDEAVLSPAEALRTQAVRDRIFAELRALLADAGGP